VTIPLEITFHNIEQSDAIEARIHEKAKRLERFHDRIVNARVVVERATARHHKGDTYEVRLDISVPGGEIVVDRNPGDRYAHEDVYVALRDAFNAATRQLEDHVRKASGHQVKEHLEPHQGTVERLFADEGYGFIRMPDGREVYFHRNAVIEGGWDKLDYGTPVRFTEAPGEKGPHAHNVTPLD
jgi:ribosomal subunit interface protein